MYERTLGIFVMSFADDFRSLLGEMDRIDLATSPNMLTTKSLFEKLMNAGFAEMEATDIVAAVDIEVSQEFIDSGLLEETTDVFANIILKMKKECQKISPFLFTKFFKTKGLSIKYR
jgi:hypothetical protein